jgi:hypothetical protein
VLAGPLKFEAAIQVMAINAVPNILYFLIPSITGSTASAQPPGD